MMLPSLLVVPVGVVSGLMPCRASLLGSATDPKPFSLPGTAAISSRYCS